MDTRLKAGHDGANVTIGIHPIALVVDGAGEGADTRNRLPFSPGPVPMSLAYPAGTKFAFQGSPGAYSDLACHGVCDAPETLPCASFEDAFAAVHEGVAEFAMIPVENSVAGRVADIHHLLPDGGLAIVGEHFQRVNHHLLALPGTRLEELRTVRSHIQALSQCRGTLRMLGIKPVSHADTAGAAADIAALGDRTVGAIASALAAKIYGLDVLRAGIEDHEHNTTRFVILAREPAPVANDGQALITSLVFRVRSVPAALFKALGGFATNGVNITKLESYLVGGRFSAAQFYAEVDGHPDDKGMRHALEELRFFAQRCETIEDDDFFVGCDERLNPASARTAMVKIIGVYPAHPFRRNPGQIGDD